MLQFKGQSYATALAEIHAQCFETPWPEPVFSDLLKLPTTFGYMTPECFVLCADLGEDVEILTIAVLPTQRRKGLATALLQTLQTAVIKHNKHHIFLEVKCTNIPAISLYKKNGFIQTGCRKNYYHEQGHTEDALCFTWEQKTSE